MVTDEIIARNLRRVRDRIAGACTRAGRNPAEVSLVAVTKYARLDWVRALVRQGECELGESRPQQLVKRASELTEPVHWQLIGSLQRNKVRLVLPYVSRIHSVDSVRLLEAIDRVAGELGLRPRLLLEVRFSGEEAKHGFEPEDLRRCWDEVQSFPHVRLEGLMTMAAYADDPEAARPAFAGLRQLRNELRSRISDAAALSHLSMGMSGDFEVAIEEGATLVRIGSALWEGLGS
jgi:pyridoxal phosphate enzyme (YggS family)